MRKPKKLPTDVYEATRDYKPHPYSLMWPICDDDSLTELRDGIKEHQQFVPAVVYEGMLLDGNRRKLAAEAAGKKFLVRDFGSRAEDGDDPLEYAYQVNRNRRANMTRQQLIDAAMKYADFKVGDHQYLGKKEGLPAGKPSKSPKTRKEAAAKFGVTEREIDRGRAVADKGVPELLAVLADETVSLTDAASIASEPPEVQRAAVAAVVKGEVKTLAKAVAATKAPPPPKSSAVADGLAQWQSPLALVVTENAAGLKLAKEALMNLVALVRGL